MGGTISPVSVPTMPAIEDDRSRQTRIIQLAKERGRNCPCSGRHLLPCSTEFGGSGEHAKGVVAPVAPFDDRQGASPT